MSVFKRFWNYVKALLSGGLDELENPEILLNQAQNEMRELHARNRERAVQAITQKNNLQQMVDDTRKKIADLEAKAERAVKLGNKDLALTILREKQSYEGTLQATEAGLQQAIEVSESVKNNIKRDEERIRQKTAEALQLKVQWKNSQIQNALEKALDGMGSIDDTTQMFERAQTKIRSATSEANARVELGRTRIETRMAELDLSETNAAAEQELAQIEARLGMPSSVATTPRPVVAASTTDSEIERQLAELEARVGRTGS